MATGTDRDGATKALRLFFDRVKGLTAEPVHRRLIKAAGQSKPQVALERELKKIVQEILDET